MNCPDGGERYKYSAVRSLIKRYQREYADLGTLYQCPGDLQASLLQAVINDILGDLAAFAVTKCVSVLNVHGTGTSAFVVNFRKLAFVPAFLLRCFNNNSVFFGPGRWWNDFSVLDVGKILEHAIRRSGVD